MYVFAENHMYVVERVCIRFMQVDVLFIPSLEASGKSYLAIDHDLLKRSSALYAFVLCTLYKGAEKNICIT